MYLNLGWTRTGLLSIRLAVTKPGEFADEFNKHYQPLIIIMPLLGVVESALPQCDHISNPAFFLGRT
jgi:hypothetical protein